MRTPLFFFLFAFFFAFSSGISASFARDAGKTPVYTLKIVEDEGAFTYYANEDLVGTSRCRWEKGGGFENRATITMAGRKIETSLEIAVDEKGLWTSIVMKHPMGKIEIARQGEAMTIVLGKRKTSLKLEPGTLIMEDMSPALMSQAVAAYDIEKGGKQTFPLFFIPSVKVEGSLEYLETFEGFTAGTHHVFRKYRYLIPRVYEIVVTVDEQNRVCLAEYPAQHGIFVREGFDALNVRAPSDALLSKPVFPIAVERNAGVPMRDGKKLATDIYRPEGEGTFPVILVRTPYKKELGDLQARFFARRGYVFALQDVRGRFASPGEWTPFVHEADDGYDAIEWLAKQPWSNGKVGMIGGSYLGWVQWWAASRRPPHLAAMIPNVSPPEPWFNFPHEKGLLFLAPALWWADVVEKELTADISGFSIVESLDILDAEKLKHLPVIDLDEIMLGKKNRFWREWIAHPGRDAYWRKLDFIAAMKGFDIPVYHQSGWFDGDGIGSKLNYLGLARQGHKNQKLLLGPWGHTDSDSRFGPHGVDFGPKAVVDLEKSYLRWMDRWLKGIDNGIDREPRVSLFVMGANDWLEGNTYPLEGTRMTKFYLASEGNAAGFEKKGLLTEKLPGKGHPGKATTAPDRYVYDPGDPTPANPEGREDILVYETPPLDAPLTLAGPLSAVLYASSSARDTDWIMRLAKIDREGNPLLLGRGAVRARYRESGSKPSLLEPGRIYEYHLDLWQTGVAVQKGERLILVVSSAFFPQFDRNLNTGGDNERETEYITAEQTVYHDRDHPSHLLLPVIPDPHFGRKREPPGSRKP